MKLEVEKVSKVIGWWVVILGALAAAWTTVDSYYATRLALANHEREESLKRIDQYEKLQHHYKDLEITNGDLTAPEKRRKNLTETVLAREYAELEDTEELISDLTQ